jgi:hypothetical protein
MSVGIDAVGRRDPSVRGSVPGARNLLVIRAILHADDVAGLRGGDPSLDVLKRLLTRARMMIIGVGRDIDLCRPHNRELDRP